MNEPPLKVWILAQMDGEIICAHCTCLAGLSETCSHVGAICFAVLNIAESTESVTSPNFLTLFKNKNICFRCLPQIYFASGMFLK